MRYLLLTLLMLYCFFSIPIDCYANGICMKNGKGNSISLRSAYFYPTARLEQKIYNSIFDIELEGFYSLGSELGFYLNVGYLEKNGRSDGLNLKTKIHQIPINLGIEYIYNLTQRTSFYMGLGPSLNYIYLNDKTPIEKKHVNKWCIGVNTKNGFYYDLTDQFFADVYLDYLYIPMKLKNTFNTGGLRIGIGIGVKL